MHDSSTGKRFQHRRQQSRRYKTNGFALPNIFTVQLQKQKRQQQQKTHNVSWPSMASTKTNEHTLNKEAEPLRSDNYVCTAREGEAFFPHHPRWKAEHYICTWTERAGTPCGPNQSYRATARTDRRSIGCRSHRLTNEIAVFCLLTSLAADQRFQSQNRE